MMTTEQKRIRHNESANKSFYLKQSGYIKPILTAEQKRIRHNESAVKHNFKKIGIENISYKDMLTIQMSGCTICNKTIIENGRALAVDHDHESNEVRGLLCNTCNNGLGYFKDSPELLQNAINYLEKHNRKQPDQ